MPTLTIDRPQRLTLPRPQQLSVRILEGRVDVIGADTDEVVIEVGAVGDKPFTIGDDDGVLTVHHDADWSRGPQFWLRQTQPRFHTEISLIVPRDCPADITVVLAEVVLSGIAAPVKVRSTNKDLTLLELGAGVDAETVGGPVLARRLHGEARLHTVSGDITVVEAGLDRLDAASVSGAITLDLDVATAGDLDLTTTTGDLTMRIPADSDVFADLQTTRGRLVCGFDELEQKRTFGFKSAGGAIGAGRGRLRAQSVTGSVTLLRRDGDATGRAAGTAADHEEAD
nr:hypothetical protein [uncultured bacterium]